MKLRLALIILATLILVGGCSAETPEFRGLWVHNWRSGLLSPAEVDATVKWAKDSNMNALVAQVRRVGDAYYDSAFEPRATNIQDSDFDPLACTISKCRGNGIEVHAWFNTYRVWTTDTRPPMPAHVVNTHPEWLSRDYNGGIGSTDGRFLDPGVPEVREYIVKLVGDIVSKYDVDGVMLDFVRYPGKDWGYNDIAVARFNAQYGRKGKPSPDDALWCKWRREQVTETVRAIRKEVERVKPEVKLSAATIAWGPCPSSFEKTDAYVHVFQDWRLWMEQGLLDANMPMNYKDPASSKTSAYYADWCTGLRKWSYGRHVYCGLMIFEDNISGIVSQVKGARAKGLDGVMGFAFSQYPCSPSLCTRLKSDAFATPAPIPEMPWKERVARK